MPNPLQPPGAAGPAVAAVLPGRRGQLVRVLLTIAAAGVLALAHLGGTEAVTVWVALLGIAFGAGLPRLLDLPHGTGAAWLLAVGAPVVVLVVRLGGPEVAVPLAAGSVLVAFLHQMLRSDGRPRLTESVAGDVLGLVIAISGAGWVVAAPHAWVLVGAAAVAAGAASSLLRLPSAAVALLAAVVGGLVGWGAGTAVPDAGWWPPVALGALVGMTTAALHRTAARSASSALRRPALAAGVLPVLASGALVAAAALVV